MVWHQAFLSLHKTGWYLVGNVVRSPACSDPHLHTPEASSHLFEEEHKLTWKHTQTRNTNCKATTKQIHIHMHSFTSFDFTWKKTWYELLFVPSQQHTHTYTHTHHCSEGGEKESGHTSLFKCLSSWIPLTAACNGLCHFTPQYSSFLYFGL